ncbi:serine kinase [candidate division KSB1 bacterium]|nr:serine kinase [candidate division KSB1 bacterium]
MVLGTIVEKLGLGVKTAPRDLTSEVTGAYVSDLLSDVMANSKEGNLWVTLQVHPNIVAVATLKDLSGIILVNGRQPAEETLKKAEEEQIPLMTTGLPTFQLVGKLYNLIGEC